jgi:Flp pilus assembly protein TadG
MEEKANRHRGEKGQSMVELALSFVVLLLLLMGVVDLGRAYFAFMSMRDAAQEGAAYGSIYPINLAGGLNTTAIVNRVRNNSTSPVNLQDTAITVDVTLIGSKACYGNGLRVDVVWTDFPLIFPFWDALFGRSTIPLRARMEETILRPPCN